MLCVVTLSVVLQRLAEAARALDKGLFEACVVDVPDKYVVLKVADFAVGKVEQAAFEQEQHVLALEVVEQDAESSVDGTGDGLDIQFLVFIEKIRDFVFIENCVDHAAVGLGVADDHADLGVAVILVQNQLFDLARDEIALVIDVVRGEYHDVLRLGIARFTLSCAEHARLEERQFFVLEAAELRQLDRLFDRHALALRELFELTVGLRGGRENAALGDAERVEGERHHQLAAVHEQMTHQLHLLRGEAAELVDIDRVSGKDRRVVEKNLIDSVEVVQRVDVRSRQSAAEYVEYVGGVEQLVFQACVRKLRVLRRMTQLL